MFHFSFVFMLQERGPRQKPRLVANITTFGVGNSRILNQDFKPCCLLLLKMFSKNRFLASSLLTNVTLANWQRFGFEFDLRSSPSAYSVFANISRPAEYFTACYTMLKRPNKVETAVHGCNLAFSLNSIVSLPR